MKLKEFLASNFIYCMASASVNVLFAIILFFLGDAPLQFVALGLLSISAAFLGFIRGISKADIWGPQLLDIFPALFYLISGILLCFGKSLQEQTTFLSVACFVMLDAFIGLMLAHEVRHYFKFWWLSILGMFLSILITFLVIPGYFFSFIPVQPLILAFLFLQGFIQLRIGLLERQLDLEGKKTIQELQNND